MYGLNTWLPKIMQKAGYPLTSSLAFLVMLNVGAVIGALSGSTVADRLGAKLVTAAGFVVAACAVLLMSRGLSIGTLYFVVAAAGLGSVGTQILLNGYVASYYGATIAPRRWAGPWGRPAGGHPRADRRGLAAVVVARRRLELLRLRPRRRRPAPCLVLCIPPLTRPPTGAGERAG